MAHTITRTPADGGVRLDCTCGWSDVVLEGASSDRVAAVHLAKAFDRREAAEDRLTGQVDDGERIDL